MRSIATLILCTTISLGAAAQTTITNAGFENWEPSGAEEPISWNSNKTGSTIAQLANATCFKDNGAHTGSFAVRLETINYLMLSVVNGSLTTGVVNAPATDKSRGYIGTINHTNSADIRRMSFTGRPDSIVGWYKYTPGAASEQGKVKVILHTDQYNDPETPTSDHPTDYSANKIGDHTWLTPNTSVTTWTRFSMPIDYTSSANPTYIMINATPSANQMTTVAGSKLWLDDLEAIYNPTTGCGTPTGLAAGTITSNSAVMTWTAPSGVVGAQYVLNGIVSAPTGSGTAISGSPFTLTALTPNTTYYFHLRDSCGATSLSPWTEVSFTTAPVGVNSVAASDFAVTAFPNPARNEVTVKINGTTGSDGQVQLMDISGRTISTTAVAGEKLTLSINELSAGIYFIRYIDSKHTQTIRINKQ